MNKNQNSSQNETGTQFFTRLLTKKGAASSQSAALNQIENVLMINKRLHLEKQIFPNGLENKQIIEIFGGPGTGKTELIMYCIARLLTPLKWKFVINDNQFEINLKDQSSLDEAKYSNADLDAIPKVILIETDIKFSIMRIFNIIEKRITIVYKNDSKMPELNQQIQNLIRKFVKECLKNLTIYKCESNEQYILVLAACEYYIQSLKENKQSITPIFIDSVNSNYELLDKYNHHLGINDLTFTENYSVILLKRLVEKHNVCVIASRSEFINPDPGKSFLDYFYNSFQKWQKIVHKRIHLLNTNEIAKNGESKKCLRLVELVSNENNKPNGAASESIIDKIFYSIKNDGFNFI